MEVVYLIVHTINICSVLCLLTTKLNFLIKYNFILHATHKLLRNFYERKFSRLTLHDFFESAFHPTKISHVGAM